MSSLVYLLLLCCLSLHACSSRLITVIEEETYKGFHPFDKDVEKEKIHETLILSSAAKGRKILIEKIIEKNCETEVPWKEKEDTKVVGLSWNDNVASSSREILQEATEIKEWKRQARRMMGSTPREAEETVDSNENDPAATQDNILVMDYAQPHKKPPIHN